MRNFHYFLTALLFAAICLNPLSSHAFQVSDEFKNVFSYEAKNDLDLSCAELSSEAERMSKFIRLKENDQKDNRRQEQGIAAATGIGGFLVGSATGGIGFAALGFFASEAMDEEMTNYEAVKDTAKERRSFMVGMFKAKQCYGPIEHINIDYNKTEDYANLTPSAGKTRTAYND